MPKHEGINRNYGAGLANQDEGPTAEERKAERDRLMKEFLAKGNTCSWQCKSLCFIEQRRKTTLHRCTIKSQMEKGTRKWI